MESKNIHREMLPIYGEKCLSSQAVYNWVQKFFEGRKNIPKMNTESMQWKHPASPAKKEV
jgi:hypothetical protein